MPIQLTLKFHLTINSSSRFSWFLIGLFCLCFTQNFAQSREELETERYRIIRHIEQTEKNLKTIRSDKKSSLAILENLETQISDKEKLIETIRQERALIDDDINTINTQKEANISELETLTLAYGKLAFLNYKNKLIKSKWSLILDAESLKEAIISWRYYKQMENFLAVQSKRIKTVKSNIFEADENIAGENATKNNLIEKETQLLAEIKEQAQEAKKEIDLLDNNEKKLRQTLKDQRSKRELLNQQIQDFILKSFSTYDDISRKLDKVNPFEQKRGFHIWPLEGGQVISRYGMQEHGEIAGIQINNLGIDIVSNDVNQVKSIASGTVVDINDSNPNDITIIVEHDFNYFSIYSHLEKVLVRDAQIISESQILGHLANSNNEHFRLHLEIRKGRETLNPIQWLKKN